MTSSLGILRPPCSPTPTAPRAGDGESGYSVRELQKKPSACPRPTGRVASRSYLTQGLFDGRWLTHRGVSGKVTQVTEDIPIPPQPSTLCLGPAFLASCHPQAPSLYPEHGGDLSAETRRWLWCFPQNWSRVLLSKCIFLLPRFLESKTQDPLTI